MRTTFYLTCFIIIVCLAVPAQSQDFAVQIAAYNQRVPITEFKPLGEVKEVVEPPFYKYFLMGFRSEAEAKEGAQKALAAGFPYARVENYTALQSLKNGCCGVMPLYESLTLRHVFFDFDKDELTNKSIADLNKLVRYLEQHSSYTVDLLAHTDALGSNDYNQKLSERRKESVRNYLISKGISGTRVSGKLFGEETPIAKNEINGIDTPKGRSLNRRVEIVVRNGDEIVPVVEEIEVPDSLK
jgi:outer membrane protein OmpA-like peptidoglycan-associated protein